MSRYNTPLGEMERNRAIFIVVIALAAALILCTIVLQTIGVGRICGGAVVIISGIIFLLANRKEGPALALLAGVLIFLFGDQLLRAIGL